MTKNRLEDLQNHLMAQMEMLADQDLSGERLAEEIRRAKAMEGLAGQMIGNARVVLDASKYAREHELSADDLPKMLRRAPGARQPQLAKGGKRARATRRSSGTGSRRR